MRCLVTGGLGFIGSHLVRALREAGHDVEVVDDGSNRADMSQPYSRSFQDISRWGSYTLYDPRPWDWIFHLAAVSRTQKAIEDPLRCNAVNVAGSLNVMELARRCKARLVLASSNIVYGSPNPYWASKLAMEHYAEAYRSLYGMNCIVLRYGNVYGPGMRWDDSLCLASLRRSAVERGYVEVTGDGEQKRDFVHVADVVRGTMLAAKSDYTGKPLDICTGDRHSLNQVAGWFNVPIRHVAARSGDSAELKQRIAPAVVAFGFSALVQFSYGIRDVLKESKPVEAAA